MGYQCTKWYKLISNVSTFFPGSPSEKIIINDELVNSWESMVKRIDDASDDVSIALIGKYTSQQDSYLSVISALKHSCIATDQKLKLIMIESSSLEKEMLEKDPIAYESAWSSLRSANGILVPGKYVYTMILVLFVFIFICIFIFISLHVK